MYHKSFRLYNRDFSFLRLIWLHLYLFLRIGYSVKTRTLPHVFGPQKTESYSGSCQTSKTADFAKKGNGQKSFVARTLHHRCFIGIRNTTEMPEQQKRIV